MMELKLMRTRVNYEALLLLGICLTINLITRAQLSISSEVVISYKTQSNKTPGQYLMSLIRACVFAQDSISSELEKISFSEFVALILKLLEDPIFAQAVAQEYPRLDISKLIVALKKVQFKTSALSIGFTLKPFFKELPQDLQDYSKLLKGITRRLAIK